MIDALARFAHALREEGVPVSPAEMLDAARALERLDLSDRSRFRAGLRATLAKDRRAQRSFDRVFDRFFLPPRRGSGNERGERGGAGAGGARSSGASDGAGSRARRPPETDDRSRRRQTGDRPGPRGDRDASRETRETREPLRKLVEQARRGARADRARGRLRVVRPPDREGEESERRRPGASTPTPLRRDLSAPASTEEEQALAREIPRLVTEIKLRSARRLRRDRRGRLWARQVFRENLAHGGVPFVLPFRRPKPRRARVVLLVDVSFSVARAAGFFLQLAAEFVRLGRDARVVAFVDRPVDATERVRKWLARTPEAEAPSAAGPGRGRARRRPGTGIGRPGRTFDLLLDSLPGLNLDAPSDYGRALHSLLHSQLRPTGRATVLVVVGDGRTNRFDPLPWTLEEIGRRCRAVLWLVPEPRARWGTADSALASYLPSVDVAVEAHDLAGLARGLVELLRTI